MIRLIFLFVLLSPAMTSLAAGTGDEDRDGVVDSRDECPATDAGAPVTMRGCAHDADGDQVADYRDNCLASPPGQPVDAWGCQLAIEIPLDGVSFEVNSARLQNDSYPLLDQAAGALLDYKGLQAEVAGHTDDQGTATHNLRLSRERAQTVRKYLISAGVPANSLRAKGYGESRPIADNETETGRHANRRVVLRILAGQRQESS